MKARLLLLALMLATPAAPAAPTAIDQLRTAAATGDADAQYRLAQAYQAGKSVAADIEMAIMWYRRAAVQGHAMASDELGFALFAHGERRAAMPYVEKAAARGDPRAFYLLGTAHFNGDLAARDWPLAYAQTARAAEAGLAAAKTNLTMMEQYLLPPDRAKADAILATLPPVRRTVATAAPAPAQPAPAATPPVVAAAPVAQASPAPTPRAPPPRPAAARKAGAWKVQLGAFGSAARAQTAWDKLVRKVTGLSALDRHIVDAGTVTRLQAWGVADRQEAQALCTKVRAAGGDCLAIAP
jgi:cell division septation protein DedD